MKKMIYLFIYMVFICSFTGCSTVVVTLEASEEQTETEISVAQESSAETFGKQDAEMENGKSASAGIETAETVTEQEMEEVTEKTPMTIICKRENTPMPEYVFPETVDLAEFAEFPYRLFISWEMPHVDGGEIYHDYGILDKENNTWKKAVERYSQEMEKVLGYPEEMIWENTDEASGRRVNRDTKERITDISPDGQFYITCSGGVYWETDGQVIWTEHEMKLYHENQYLRNGPEEVVGDYFINRQLNAPFGIWLGRKSIYNLLDGTEELCNLGRFETALNQDASLAAVSASREGSVCIYNMQGQALFNLKQPGEPYNRDSFHLHVYQFVGNQNSGFILFEDPMGVYKLHYPDGEVELMGHYMFNPSLSPDGKYLFYTSPDIWFWMDYAWEDGNYEEYKKIPVGMYIRELETGKTAYIEMDDTLKYQDIEVRWLEDFDN